MIRGAALLSLLTLAGCSAGPPAIPQRVLDWEPAIARFEKADRAVPPRKGGVLFIGSSSIRMWKTLKEDFPGRDVLNRGFGGSHIEDSLFYADRIAIPYHPQTVVLYAGDNDIAAGKSPSRVYHDFARFAEKLRWHLPRTRLVFIAIKPSLSRWRMVGRMREANELIKAYIHTQPGMAYADIFTPMLGKNGRPRKELFAKDGLHLSRKGYALWRHTLLPLLSIGRESTH